MANIISFILIYKNIYIIDNIDVRRDILFYITTLRGVDLFVTLERERVNNWFRGWKRDHR
jgi:hypothetical protein